jgi:hypothetical protein
MLEQMCSGKVVGVPFVVVVVDKEAGTWHPPVPATAAAKDDETDDIDCSPSLLPAAAFMDVPATAATKDDETDDIDCSPSLLPAAAFMDVDIGVVL